MTFHAFQEPESPASRFPFACHDSIDTLTTDAEQLGNLMRTHKAIDDGQVVPVARSRTCRRTDLATQGCRGVDREAQATTRS